MMEDTCCLFESEVIEFAVLDGLVVAIYTDLRLAPELWSQIIYVTGVV
jgi:hypothetical protein